MGLKNPKVKFHLAETRYWEELRTSPCFSVSKAADEPHKDDMIIISNTVGLKSLSLLAIVVHSTA